MKESFSGDRKAPMRSPLAAAERRLINWLVPRMPSWVGSHHLTLMTLAWTAGLLISGWLGRRNPAWFWGASLMLFLQWFTDSVDGSLGRYRDTGLRRWGFYMDHLLDYLFMPSVFAAWALAAETDLARGLFLGGGAAYALLMVHSFLYYGATGEFRITYLFTGPTEVRLYFIFANTGVVFYGLRWLAAAMPFVIGVLVAATVFLVWQAHRSLWALDMEEKRQRLAAQSNMRGSACEDGRT